MSLKTCFLHIGSTKTGSTSIQATLHENRELLKRHGYLYPDIHRNHRFLIVCISANENDWPKYLPKYIREIEFKSGSAEKKVKQKYIKYFEEMISKSTCHTVILSDEVFSNLAAKKVQSLKDFLTPYFSRIVVICYIRHPYSHLISLAQSSLRTLAQSSERLKYFHPTKLEKSYVRVFGVEAIKVREFERRALKSGDVVDDFCSVIGLPPDIVKQFSNRRRRNESLSMEAALIVDAYLERVPNPSRAGRRLGLPLITSLKKISGQKFSLPRKIIEGIADDANKEVEYVRKRFGVSLREPRLETPDPATMWQKETLRDIGRLLSAMAVRIEELQYRNRIATVRSHLNNKEPALARGKLEDMFRGCRLTPDYYLLLARVQNALGEPRSALSALKDGRERFPGSKEIIRRLDAHISRDALRRRQQQERQRQQQERLALRDKQSTLGARILRFIDLTSTTRRRQEEARNSLGRTHKAQLAALRKSYSDAKEAAPRPLKEKYDNDLAG